jgi:succinate-semialdehyde dehydrogenase/glutarate-semialdehyde dehydrogenase
MPIVSINPATEELLERFEALSEAALEDKLARAWECFQVWQGTEFAYRSERLLRAAEILEAEKAELGAVITKEMGKTLVSAVAEVAKCALGCRYYAENAEQFLKEETIPTNASRSYVKYEPMGPVLAVMPWNFPFWQVFRFAAPALMAGNVGLLKHAGNVPQCALAIESVLQRAGFPEGAFQTLLIEADRVAHVLEDDRIRAATLTGSEAAGRAVGSAAGGQIKKTVLELGGSDPFIVMPSGAGGDTVAKAINARTINNGQSCIAAKRFLIADAVYEEFTGQFVEGMNALRLGCPMEPETEVGPLATAKVRSDLEEQVASAVALGARVLAGGRRPARRGFFFEPTVLVDVPRGSKVFYEEFFGPVALLFRVQDAHEAIALANDSPFGLGASVWTKRADEQQLFIERLETGQVFVNAIVASDPRLPFGGVKRSGYGRELAGVGMREFMNSKTVFVK